MKVKLSIILLLITNSAVRAESLRPSLGIAFAAGQMRSELIDGATGIEVCGRYPISDQLAFWASYRHLSNKHSENGITCDTYWPATNCVNEIRVAHSSLDTIGLGLLWALHGSIFEMTIGFGVQTTQFEFDEFGQATGRKVHSRDDWLPALAFLWQGALTPMPGWPIALFAGVQLDTTQFGEGCPTDSYTPFCETAGVATWLMGISYLF